ncbi:MAG: DnaD domain protein [Tissierellia bacterium]|nr:DnaD domain protein [Tissierellia bacterium]
MRFLEGKNIVPQRTSISDIFLSTLLPKAKGDYVKVYLYGYYLMKQSLALTADEFCIHLQLEPNVVAEAFAYWQDEGIVEIVDGETLVFFDPDSLSLENLSVAEDVLPDKNPEAMLIQLNQNPELRQMFSEADSIVRRTLVPEEKKRFLRWMEEYHVDCEMILHALSYTYDIKQVKHLDYVEGILRRWYDKGYTALDQVLEEEPLSDQMGIQEIVKRSLNLKERDMTPIAKEMIESWTEEMGFGEDIISLACAQTINIREPNISYVNAVLKNWYEEGVRSLEDAKKAMETHTTKKPKGKNKWQISDERRTDDYGETELEELLRWKGDL